jgi:hypothetical protein
MSFSENFKKNTDFLDRRRSSGGKTPDETSLQRKNRLLELVNVVNLNLSQYRSISEVASVIRHGFGLYNVFVMMLNDAGDRTLLIGHSFSFSRKLISSFLSISINIKKTKILEIYYLMQINQYLLRLINF